MFRVFIIITALFHLPFAVTAAGVARALHLPHPVFLGVAAAIALFLSFRTRLRVLIPDRPRPRWGVHLVDEPLFIHWCAAFWSAVPVALGCLVSPAVDALRGLSPSLPYRFAVAAYGSGLALSLWGVLVRRRWVMVRRIELPIAGLPREFDGYRVVQLSDLHIGSLTPPAWGQAWADKSNAVAPDLVVVTGDLVTSGVAFHEEIAAVVGRLRARDGVLVSMGNHDYFGDGEPLVSLLERAGARVLRNEGTTVSRGAAELFVAGVDDTWTKRANLARALARRKPGVTTVLLAHDPELFPEAAEQGASLVLSGHTHGGQVAMPFFARFVTLSRLAHRFHLGLYRAGSSLLYVHGGLGTTGPPIRLGVPPEIAVFTLKPG